MSAIYGVDLFAQIDGLIDASLARSTRLLSGQSGHQMAGKARSFGREWRRRAAIVSVSLAATCRTTAIALRPSSRRAVASSPYTFLCTALVWSKRLHIARVILELT